MIQKVTRSAKNIDYWSYSVIASSTLFGITEFLQLLLKRSDRWEVDASELVDIVQNIDEVITLQDQYTFSRTSLPFKAGLINKKTRDFKTQRFANSNPNGVSNNQKVMNDWYADNYGTKSYSTSHFVAENPLLQMQVLD